MGLASVNVTQLGQKAAVSREIAQRVMKVTGPLRSVNVSDFGTNRKPVCDL